MLSETHSKMLPEINLNLFSSIEDLLLNPVYDALENFTRSARDCPGFLDRDFVRAGVMRTLSQCKSGRDFLQQQRELFDSAIGRTAFFNSLHSCRRRDVLREVSERFMVQAERQLRAEEDLLALFPELSDRSVWAVDGHQIEHACHAMRDSKGRFVSVNTLYLLDLHTGLLATLAPVQGNGTYSHEMPVFRAAARAWLKQGRQRARGAMPIFVNDPAFIDNPFWSRASQMRQCGAAMITLLKENMNPEKGVLLTFDRLDEVNRGVDGDLKVVFSNGITMRLVIYTDPETGECYHFLTTCFDLRPGVIAWLYFLRWRIEKVFDTSKNKLEEKKAWANGKVAQEIQGHFLALTHNILVLFRHYLSTRHHADEEKLKRKRDAALKKRVEAAGKKKRRLHPLTFRLPSIVQLSLQFIRSIRNLIAAKATLKATLPQITAMLTAYL
jgi:hypothetical protein